MIGELFNVLYMLAGESCLRKYLLDEILVLEEGELVIGRSARFGGGD
jgi:hypothetical protein